MRILSPVYLKELGQLAVGRRMLAMQAVLLAVLIGFVVVVMVTTRLGQGMDEARLGRDLFSTFAVIELVAVAIFAPIVTAGVVCGEREANTLGLLFLTRLKSFQIVQDKGLSRLTFLVMIIFLSLPFMFAALLFGGVENRQIVSAIGNTLAVMLFAGGVSLLSSTIARGFGTALVTAYAILLAYLVVFPVLFLYGLDQVAHVSISEEAASFINPLVSTIMSAEPGILRRRPLVALSWGSNLAFGLIVYGFAVLVASFLLRRTAFASGSGTARESGSSAIRSVGRAIRKLALVGPAMLLDRGAAIRGNPVQWKESGLLNDSLKTTLAILGNVVLVIYILTLLLLDAGGDLSSDWPHFVIHALAFAAFAFASAILGACSFSRQKEAGTFDVLLTTRLPGRTVVLGTFGGLLKSLAPFALTLFAILLVGSVSAPTHFHMALPLVNMVVYLPFFMVLGMYMSLLKKTTAGAVAWTFGILLTLTVILPFLAGMLHSVIGNDLSGAMMACSPDYWVAASPEIPFFEYGNHRGFEKDFGGTTGYVLVTAAYTVATVIMLLSMIRRFDRITGRQPGGRGV